LQSEITPRVIANYAVWVEIKNRSKSDLDIIEKIIEKKTIYFDISLSL